MSGVNYPQMSHDNEAASPVIYLFLSHPANTPSWRSSWAAITTQPLWYEKCRRKFVREAASWLPEGSVFTELPSRDTRMKEGESASSRTECEARGVKRMPRDCDRPSPSLLPTLLCRVFSFWPACPPWFSRREQGLWECRL